VDLYYETHGTGEPVVLIHSGGQDLRDWQFIAPRLARTYRVVAFDGRGAGRSPAPVEPVNYVEDLRKLLDYLGVGTAALVGHSIGGQLATDFALTYPDRVSRLTLIGPALSGYQFSPAYARLFARVQAAAPDVKKMTELALDFPSYRVVLAGPQRALMVQMTEDNLRKMLDWKTTEQVWPQPPAIERLDTLAAPTLFIVGTQDTDDLFRIAEQFERVPAIRFARIDGADHMPTLTHPEEVSRLITRFLGE